MKLIPGNLYKAIEPGPAIILDVNLKQIRQKIKIKEGDVMMYIQTAVITKLPTPGLTEYEMHTSHVFLHKTERVSANIKLDPSTYLEPL